MSTMELMMNVTADEKVTVDAAALIVGKSRKTIYRLLWADKLPGAHRHERLGHWVIPIASLRGVILEQAPKN